MAQIEPEAAAAKKGGESEDKKDKKKPEDGDGKEGAAKPPIDDGDEDDDKKEGKKAAGVVAITGEPLKGMRAESEIQAIAALCKMAGKPEKAAEFLMQKNPKGQYLSVVEVSEALTSSRVAESESSMISSHVNPNAGAGGIQEVEAQAVAFARQNRGKVSAGLYVSGTDTKITKERSYALMLEEHPEAYVAFRAQHNAKALVATLEAAGIRLAR